MKLGEPDLLFPGKASCFVVSTGTTGVPKYIPESDAGALAKNIVSRMRIRAWRRMLPEVFTPESKIFPITNAAMYERTGGGIPAGSASGLTAASGKGKRQPRNVIPPALLTTPELAREDTDYLMMLFAFAEKNVACIALNNVAHFHLLWNVVRERPYDFIDDIRQGTLSAQVPDEARKALLEDWRANPERADELEALLNSRGTLEPGDVWPHLRMVVCWIAGSVGRSAQEYRSMFPPETVFVNWGYGASEGKFDVPVEAESVEGVLALFGYVYEFVKPGESVAVPLWEAADDTPYELVFTNYAGFYRYNIHDLVSWAQMQMAFAPSAFWARRPTPSRLPVMRSSVDSMDALAKSCFGAMDIEGEEGLFVLYAPGKTELSMNMVAGWIILGRTEVIGRDGYVIVADQTGTVVASDMVDQIGKTLDYSSLRTVSFFGTNLSIMDVLGEESYVRRLKVVEHDLIGVCPTAAIHSVFFTFCQMVAPIALASLALLVILLNLFLKRSMVEGVAHTNDSLAKITAGDLDERVEVRTFKEFDELSDGINSTVGKPKDLIEKEAARIDEELAMARTIQHEALPSTFPPFPQRTEFGLHASMDAAREVGGDFYDYFLIADNKLAFLVADVSDKGIPAALFMMRAKTAIKARLMNGLPIEEAMMRANEDLCANNEAGMFVTAWVGVLDTCTGIVEYVHAGHTCPVLVQGHSPAVVRKKRNFIMGGRPMIRYVRQEVALEPNDMIVLYSDGVSEAFDAQGEQYGLDRLENLLAKETPAIESDDPNRRCELACTTIKSDVARFSEGITQSDDITILCVVYLGEGTRA